MALSWNSGYWTAEYWQYLHPGSTGIAVRSSHSTSGSLYYRMTSSDKWNWVEVSDGWQGTEYWIYHNGGDNWWWWGWSATKSSGYTYFTLAQSSYWVDGWWSGSTDIDYYWPTSEATSGYSLWSWETIYAPGHTVWSKKANTHTASVGSGTFTCKVMNRGSQVTSQTGSYTTTRTWTFKGWRGLSSNSAPSYTASSTHTAGTWYNISSYTYMFAVFNSPSDSTSYSNNSISFSKPSNYTASGGSRTVTLNNNGSTSTLSSALTDTWTFSKWTNAAGTTVTSPYTFYSTDTVTSNFTKSSTSAAAVTLPTPTRSGYTFQGWSTTSGGSVAYSGGASYTPSSNVTLYAVWKQNLVTLTLKNSAGWTDSTYGPKGGGDYSPGASVTVTQAVKTGWHFVNWTNSSGTSLSTSASYTFTMPSSSTTYTANVARNTYTVTYNANGGVGTTANSSHEYGVSKALTANGYTKLGYTFKGWATSLSNANAGTVAYTNQQSVSNLSSTHGATVTLYAVWEPYSNMYIYSNGSWHKALKYIYTSK